MDTRWRYAGLGLGLSALWLAGVGCGCGGGSSTDAGGPIEHDAAVMDAGTPPGTDAGTTSACTTATPFAAPPYGVHRGDLAGPFTLPLVSEPELNFATAFDGCDHVVFVPDTLRVSAADASSIWEHDLGTLVAISPPNVHYVFVSRQSGEAATNAIAAMRTRVLETLDALDEADRAHWTPRLHVVAMPAAELSGWIGTALATGIGRAGLAIDRLQRLHGLGQLADVSRFDGALQAAGQWPWRANLAYVGYEARWLEADATTRTRLANEHVSEVALWSGETLAQYAEVDAELPTATALRAFDTLEIEVTLRCPDEDAIELGNCGAWDYLARLFVMRDDTTPSMIELARFITSYHRETHWVVDATPMLPLLAAGGSTHLRWDFAPEWNTQPTKTWISLRFSSRGRGLRPTSAVPLFGGGSFGSGYDALHPAVDVPIAATARRVELVALLTGHGSGTNRCAEFCNHEHAFTVGKGASHRIGFPEAGTDRGCMSQIEHGMVPNQGGTWWFGRGGWCPGQQVAPHVIDVTADVVPGTSAHVTYRGLYAGATPPDDSGDIQLTSWLVIYE